MKEHIERIKTEIEQACKILKHAMYTNRWDDTVSTSIVIHNLCSSLNNLTEAESNQKETGDWS